MYTNDDALEIERIVGTKNIEKLIVADPNVQVTAKSTVFTP
jgi:hypothetical protein